MKNISHDEISTNIRQQIKPMMNTIYERVRDAYNNQYTSTTTSAVKAQYSLTVGDYILKILVGSPKPLAESGNEYIYIVLENEFARFYISGILANSVDRIVTNMETLPGIFDLLDAFEAFNEIVTTTIPNGWSFPVGTIVVNKQ